MKKFFFFIIILLLAFYTGIEYQFQNLELKGYNTNNKIWIHRGGTPENTITGISQSINQGFDGVEIDIHFDKKSSLFFVGHDLPTKNEPSLPTLELFLGTFKDLKIHWWFDLKNLNQDNAIEISRKFKVYEKDYKLIGHYFIESNQYTALKTLASYDLPTIYWLNPHTKSRLFYLRMFENKVKLIFSNFLGVSLYYESYNEKAKSYLSDIPKFIFTVNGELKNQYIKDQTIQVVLTDDR